MVSVKGTASKLEMEILGGIIEPDCPNIEFKNVTFDCKSIKDAAGNIFINQTYCNFAPVRHGHWRLVSRLDEVEWLYGAVIECSQCKHEEVAHYNYCPNCGARMDGDEDE